MKKKKKVLIFDNLLGFYSNKQVKDLAKDYIKLFVPNVSCRLWRALFSFAY